MENNRIKRVNHNINKKWINAIDFNPFFDSTRVKQKEPFYVCTLYFLFFSKSNCFF